MCCLQITDGTGAQQAALTSYPIFPTSSVLFSTLNHKEFVCLGFFLFIYTSLFMWLSQGVLGQGWAFWWLAQFGHLCAGHCWGHFSVQMDVVLQKQGVMRCERVQEALWSCPLCLSHPGRSAGAAELSVVVPLLPGLWILCPCPLSLAGPCPTHPTPLRLLEARSSSASPPKYSSSLIPNVWNNSNSTVDSPHPNKFQLLVESHLLPLGAPGVKIPLH